MHLSRRRLATVLGLFVASLFCIALVFVRNVHTGDVNFRYLIWNLFLAWIPFGLAVFVYDDADYESVLHLVDEATPYALTGAVFATERTAIEVAHRVLRQAAGNFYVNDKPTGAVVGQQPFGGARASGTNDKAGSKLNLVRWVSARTVKETHLPSTDHRYPHMEEE